MTSDSPSGSSLPYSDERLIDEICDRFEAAWRSGQLPRIEDYLSEVPTGHRDVLLRQLVMLELELRRAGGETCARDDYLQRFSADRSVVDDAFDLADSRHRPPTPLTATVDMQDFFVKFSPGQEITHSARESSDEPEIGVGRFVIERQLGRGGFALVFLARDTELDRLVALKVPRPDRFRNERDLERFLREARLAAGLDHPGIVRVYDVHREPGWVYIVQQYVPGQDLASAVRRRKLTYRQIAELLIAIAEAVGHAHGAGLYHRDLKLANILLDEHDRPVVADFGLALEASRQHEHQGELAGSYPCMSPEQARGEVHRLDGRTDIWGLGVILYELLTGERPFAGDDLSRLFDEIEHRDPRPPRQVVPAIPAELSRICLVCLAKRPSDRYPSTADLVDDLRHWLASGGADAPRPQPKSSPAPIVPKGLRSFDAADADFFLDLLPGPKDREGMPKIVRFWKTRIEENDADETFSVGLLYGPSGCGKSSLVKAGLMPRLGAQVVKLYLEATPDDTEVRLLKGLRKVIADLPAGQDLPQTLRGLRESGLGAGRKLLIVIDQFEQWLHSRSETDRQLIEALRQCDGSVLQCLILVRDDFWLAVSRFMRDLEVRLVEDDNSTMVDLFDLQHARRVLTAFGGAYGRINSRDHEKQLNQFVDQAVAGLQQDGHVVCVQLALFAEMMKAKVWSPASLRHVGGTAGVGVAFLEETFAGDRAAPAHRLHQQAARRVLRALLPDSGADIKGHMRSSTELLNQSGYAQRADDFDRLISILDAELRLITPTDPEGAVLDREAGSRANDTGEAYYQLTHDYLVPSLREWLYRKQRETARGRAELRLAELAAAWHDKPENRKLPTWWEFPNLWLRTDHSQWTEAQRGMMRRAARVQGAWFLVGSIVVAMVLAGGVASRRQYRSSLAKGYVEQLLSSSPEGLPAFVQLVRPLRSDALPWLRQGLATQGPQGNDRRLHAACALAELGETDFQFPWETLRTTRAAEGDNVVSAMSRAPPAWLDQLEARIDQAANQQDWRFQSRLAILALFLRRPTAAATMLDESRPDPTPRTIFLDEFASWHGDLMILAPYLPELDTPTLRAGVCLAAGGVTVDSRVQQAWEATVSRWFEQQPDGITHSCAGWLLRRWNLPVPTTLKAGPEFGWRKTDRGLTLIQITPYNEADKTCFVSDREITVGLFQQFLDDSSYSKAFPDEFPREWESYDRQISPTSDHPVQRVRWYEAVMFCNWLSRQANRQPAYRLTGKQEQVFGRDYNEWEPVKGANGYRLPSEAEWQWACGGNRSTRYSFGDDERLLTSYATYVVNATSQAAPVGRLRCNPAGLFDMHGNVAEWCDNWFARGTARSYRGGSWLNGAKQCQTRERSGNNPGYRGSYLGFRVVHSVE